MSPSFTSQDAITQTLTDQPEVPTLTLKRTTLFFLPYQQLTWLNNSVTTCSFNPLTDNLERRTSSLPLSFTFLLASFCFQGGVLYTKNFDHMQATYLLVAPTSLRDDIYVPITTNHRPDTQANTHVRTDSPLLLLATSHEICETVRLHMLRLSTT